MKKTQIVESKGNTYFIKGRGFPKGCQYCLKGQKAVLFLNGICQKPTHCSYYCPISEERRGKDVTFADEIEISTNEDLLKEINMINAKGMGVTGGEPLLETNLEKTLDFIRYVKAKKGKKFHTHLYTNGLNFSSIIAQRLASTGLDEIRFHPPKDKWENIQIALNRGYIVGAEVPVIPEEDYIKYLEELILYLDKIGADFINLNEFEMCEPNSKSLKEKGFLLQKGTIASVENSKEMAMELIRRLSSKVSIKIHFCSIRAKDYYQLKNRYLRRAKSIKLPYEIITDEGLLLFAKIEGENEKLSKFHKSLLSEYNAPEELIDFNEDGINLPYNIALEDDFIAILDQLDLKGFIIEMIPFRGKYQQITERSPIQVFKEEYT
jgi:pyruvate formate-lyase activating enzyme-like uncharacterized protein